MRFYSSFNALYSKSKSSNCDLVCVDLVKSFCLPWGYEVTDFKKSVCAMPDNLIYRIVIKTSEKDVIRDIRNVPELLDVEALCVKKH